MSHDTEVYKSTDDMIRRLGVRESGIEDYAIGRKISVSYRGGDRFLCHTCVANECSHVDRIRRFRNEHLEELNFAKADPATEVPVV